MSGVRKRRRRRKEEGGGDQQSPSSLLPPHSSRLTVSPVYPSNQPPNSGRARRPHPVQSLLQHGYELGPVSRVDCDGDAFCVLGNFLRPAGPEVGQQPREERLPIARRTRGHDAEELDPLVPRDHRSGRGDVEQQRSPGKEAAAAFRGNGREGRHRTPDEAIVAAAEQFKEIVGERSDEPWPNGANLLEHQHTIALNPPVAVLEIPGHLRDRLPGAAPRQTFGETPIRSLVTATLGAGELIEDGHGAPQVGYPCVVLPRPRRASPAPTPRTRLKARRNAVSV